MTKNVVCPWCGERFEKRSQLSWHWINNPECKTNRFVNSPLKTKNNVVPRDVATRPMLTLVKGGAS